MAASRGVNEHGDVKKRGSFLFEPLSGWGFFWLLLIIPIVLILLIWGVVVLTNYLSPREAVVRKADDTLLFKGSELGVTLEVSVEGADTSRAPQPVPRAVDMVVCVDVSGSMGDPNDSESGLFRAKQVLQSLSVVFTSHNRRMGLIEFESHPRVLCGLTSDPSKYAGGLSQLSSRGGTNIEGALQEGVDVLSRSAQPAGGERYLIIISDGQDPNHSACRNVTSAALEDSIVCVGIGVGYSSDAEFFEDVFLPPHIFLGAYGDPADLGPVIFGLVDARGLMPVAARNGNLVEPLNSKAFAFDSTKSPFLVNRVDAADGVEELHWAIPFLAVGENKLPYTVLPLRVGVNRIAVGPAGLEYSPAPGGVRTAASGVAPRVFVISPWLIFWLYLPALLWLLWMLAHRVPLLHRAQPVLALALPPPDLSPVPHFEIPSVSEVPTLVIGLGGGGIMVATHLKHNLRELMPRGDIQRIRVIGIDTDREHEPPSAFGSSLADEEMVHVPEKPDLAELVRDANLDARMYPYLEHWFPAGEFAGRADAMNSLKGGAQGDRRLARAGFMRALELNDRGVRDLKSKLRGFAEREKDFQILIAASVDGGTGSGLLFDLAVALKRWCKDLELEAAPSIATFLFSHLPDKDSSTRVRATLEELERFQSVAGLSALAPDLKLGEGEGEGQGWDGSLGPMKTPLFDRWYIFEPDVHPGAVADVLLLYCEESQRASLREILHDADRRVRHESLGETHEAGQKAPEGAGASIGHPRGCLVEVKSIRFALGSLIDRLRLTAVMGLLDQVLDVEALERADERKMTEWAHQPTVFWRGKGVYEALADRADASTLSSWHAALLQGGKELPSPGDETAVSGFYAEALPAFLNGVVEGLDDRALEAANRGRLGRVPCLNAFLKRMLDSGRRLAKEGVLDEPTGRYLDALNGIHEKLIAEIGNWTSVLIRNAEISDPEVVDERIGLYLFAQRMLASVDEIEEEAAKVPNRTYMTDGNGNPELAFARLWKETIEKRHLENGALLRRVLWSVDDQCHIRLHFTGLREVPLSAGPGSAASGRLLGAFTEYFDNQIVPDLWQTSLAHKLMGGSVKIEDVLAAHKTDTRYTMLTVPDIHRWPEFLALRDDVRERTAAGRYLSDARIRNPLWISMAVVDPGVTIGGARVYLDASAIAGGVGRRSEPKVGLGSVPYQFPEEKRSVFYLDRLAHSSDRAMRDRVHSPGVRALLGYPRVFRAMVIAMASGQMCVAQRGPLRAWGIEIGGRFNSLQEWGKLAWLSACQRFVTERAFWDGTPIPEELYEGESARANRDSIVALADKAASAARDDSLSLEERETWELIGIEALFIAEEMD